MPKYVLTGADSPLGRAAADFALEIAQPGDELVFTTYQRARVPADVMAAWEARGARVVDLAYDDATAALTTVFAGAAAVAFATPWTAASAQRRAQAANVIAACQATKTAPGPETPPPRLVYASLVGAGRPEAQEAEEEESPEAERTMPALVRDHATVERALAASGLPHTVHRDFLHADMVAEVFAPAWRYGGDAWLDNSRHVRGGYVARGDCGRAHAALLLLRGDARHRDGRRAYDVTGPELVTAGQMLDWACAQTGYHGELVSVDDAELRRWWAARGLPAATADAAAAREAEGASAPPMRLGLDDLVACGQLVARGYMQEITDTVERLTGRVPRCFRQTLVHYKDALPRADDTSDCDHVGASREEER